MQTDLGLANLPIIVYTGKELTHQEENESGEDDGGDHHQRREIPGTSAG